MERSSSKLTHKLIVILGVLGVSFSAIFVRFSTAPSLVLVMYRIGFTALIMTIPGIKALKADLPNITKKDLICALISGTFLAFHFGTYFAGVKRTNIASATVLVDLEVFFVAFALIFVFKEKLGKMAWAGIVITFAGSVIIALSDSASSGSIVGDLLALSGAFFMSIYTLMGRVCRKHMSTATYTFIIYWITTIVSFLILLATRVPVTGYGSRNLLCAFGMTILCTLMGHSIFNWGLKTVSAAYISIVKFLEPVFASILGIIIFSEVPGIFVCIGAVIVIAGVYITGKFTDF